MVDGEAERHKCGWKWFRRFVVDLSALACQDDPAAPFEERRAVRSSCVRVVSVFHGFYPDSAEQLQQRAAVLQQELGAAELPLAQWLQHKAAGVPFSFDLVVAPSGDRGHGLFAMRSCSRVPPHLDSRRRLLQPATWLDSCELVNVRGREHRWCIAPLEQSHYLAPYTGLPGSDAGE